MSSEASAVSVITVSPPDWKVRAAEAFCWAVWATLLLLAIRLLVTHTSNIPLSEDWNMVPAFAGLENHFGAWLWEQNNEHRVPVPKLILLAILKLTGGSFKAGMAANLAFLAAISAAMMVAVKSGRGGHARFTDAFFPVIFLNLGHWENMYWAWEMTFILSVLLGCIPLVVLAARRPLNTVVALWVGGAMIAAPLCGATGVLYVPLLTLWAAYVGLTSLRTGGPKRTAWTLLVSSILTVGVCGLYFVGYSRPQWTGPPATVAETLRAASEFLALAFGPAARLAWALSVLVTLILLFVTAQCLVSAVRRANEPERPHILGLVAFFLTMLFYAVAIGHGRAHVVVSGIYPELPMRYCLLAVPVLCVMYIATDQFGTSALVRHLPSIVCIAVFVLLPLNIGQGYGWEQSVKPEISGIYEDIQRGMSSDEIAKRHNEYLIHWKTPQEVSELIRIASRAKIYPFSSTRLDPDLNLANEFVPEPQTAVKKSEIRCHIPGATRVVLIWGVNGWKWLPKPWLPADTVISGGTMHTAMQQDGDWFRATLAVPEGQAVDYGFNIYGQDESHPLWQAGAEVALLPALPQIAEVPTNVLIDTDGMPIIQSSGTAVPYRIQYYVPSASEVHLVWGVEGWRPVAQALRPQNTQVRKRVMHTSMVRDGDAFIANLLIPAGSTIDYGFLIRKRTGIFNLESPLWEGKPEYHAVVVKPGGITVQGPKWMGTDWARSIPPLSFWWRLAAAFAMAWTGLFAALWLRISRTA